MQKKSGIVGPGPDKLIFSDRIMKKEEIKNRNSRTNSYKIG